MAAKQVLLNLPKCDLKIEKNEDGLLHKEVVFCIVRKQWVALTPEELVRQYFVHYLVNHLATPVTLISIEQSFQFNNGKCQRADIVTYDSKGNPMMLVECKSPSVKLSKTTFMQASRYNAVIKANYIVITNGITHHCASTSDWISYGIENAIPSWR